ncbi:YueI family protein [Amphibacillus sp. Q70]|uniref:YueI family protein n=1 Tax=Amphibacillus sp. Q70 TaxID=3453416 RepID=UPI003F86B1CE
MGKNIDDYLNEGIHGTRQTNPDERRKFLGSLRERAAFVLTSEQITNKIGLNDLNQKLAEHPDAQLLLNGLVPFEKLNPYRHLAIKHDISYTIIDEKNNTSAYGLVLCYDHAVDIEEIHFKEKQPDDDDNQQEEQKPSFWKKLFGFD